MAAKFPAVTGWRPRGAGPGLAVSITASAATAASSTASPAAGVAVTCCCGRLGRPGQRVFGAAGLAPWAGPPGLPRRAAAVTLAAIGAAMPRREAPVGQLGPGRPAVLAPGQVPFDQARITAGQRAAHMRGEHPGRGRAFRPNLVGGAIEPIAYVAALSANFPVGGPRERQGGWIRRATTGCAALVALIAAQCPACTCISWSSYMASQAGWRLTRTAAA
jgi:hypothetical protein